MKKLISLAVIVVLGTSTLLLNGCARGEDDPWLTFHTRDARISQPWILKKMTGTIVTTTNGNTENIEYEYDGTRIYITHDGVTTSYIYSFTMNCKDNGELFSTESMVNENDGSTYASSSKTSFWFWGDDKQNKTNVNLDLTGLFASYPTYDIPRLAWNDMSLDVDYSDNYTIWNEVTEQYDSFTESVLLQLQFDVDLTAIK
ncbi:MAG: hypothetical protein R2794_07105 [Chitinophagales bacterium]